MFDPHFRCHSRRLISVRKSLLAMLKSIHKAGVIHGDIRLSNLCVNDAGEAFIIDFSHAEKSSSRATMDYMDLRICVPI
jgi:tRNA A-37 threonylcarbamoyl transferase component Bud32